MALFDSLVKPALDSVSTLIGQFHMSPEQQAQARQALADAAATAQKAALDYDVQMNQIASSNIRAEATTGDKFTERARPSFMYVVIAVLGFNYIVLPLASACGLHATPVTLPSDLLTLFGVCVTGYSVSRSVDKALSLPGESNVTLLGVVKASNKQ